MAISKNSADRKETNHEALCKGLSEKATEAVCF